MKLILLIDNYDSFTYNLVQMLDPVKSPFVVHRNDKISMDEIESMDPSAVILSPGPGKPIESGVCLTTVAWAVRKSRPLLGVCLGHQALGECFGMKLIRSKKIMHGKSSLVDHDGKGLFEGLPSPVMVGRYHSLCLDPKTLNKDLEITARSSDGTLMGLRHRRLPLYGVQFHPESVLTTGGNELMNHFISLA